MASMVGLALMSQGWHEQRQGKGGRKTSFPSSEGWLTGRSSRRKRLAGLQRVEGFEGVVIGVGGM